MDREKVIKGMEQFRADMKPFCGSNADWERFDAGLSMLKEQQEQIDKLLEEKPQIVRCKDCKYGEPWGVLIGCGTTKGFGITHKPDWFCADGERRTE